MKISLGLSFTLRNTSYWYSRSAPYSSFPIYMVSLPWFPVYLFPLVVWLLSRVCPLVSFVMLREVAVAGGAVWPEVMSIWEFAGIAQDAWWSAAWWSTHGNGKSTSDAMFYVRWTRIVPLMSCRYGILQGLSGGHGFEPVDGIELVFPDRQINTYYSAGNHQFCEY